MGSQARRHNQPFSQPHTRSPTHPATQPSTPGLSHPACQHHQTRQPPATHTGFHAVSVKQAQSKQCPCACPVTQTCTVSLGVYSCPRHNQASSIPGVLVLGGRSLYPPCVCSSRTLRWASFIPVLSIFCSYDKPGWGRCHPRSHALPQSAPWAWEKSTNWPSADLSTRP